MIYSKYTKEQQNSYTNYMKKLMIYTLLLNLIKNEPLKDKCDCPPKKSIPFLDTLLSIENGRIVVDLHKKPLDRNQYLLPSSCHPKSTTQAIPYSLSLRIVRICTKPESRDLRLSELKVLLLAREYPNCQKSICMHDCSPNHKEMSYSLLEFHVVRI